MTKLIKYLSLRTCIEIDSWKDSNDYNIHSSILINLFSIRFLNQQKTNKYFVKFVIISKYF